jgi:hypothetical protein
VQDAVYVYRDRYVVANGGGIAGWWNFPHGMELDHFRTGSAASRNAVLLVARSAPFNADSLAPGVTVPQEYSREVAYALNTYQAAERLGGGHRLRRDLMVTQALGHIDSWFVSRTCTYMRPFMVGLTLAALIDEYRETGDQRIPPAVRIACDGMWNLCWLPAEESFAYTDRNFTPGDTQRMPAPDLNLLIAPAYAWIYLQTGNTVHRDRADAIFVGGIKGAWMDGPKQYNQSYRWSFDYVKWRKLSPTPIAAASAATFDAKPPVISGIRATSTSSGAVITWTTNAPSDSRVVIGSDLNFASPAPSDSAKVTSHSLTVSGCAPNTIYYFRVASADAAGALGMSDTNSLRTLSSGSVPPVVDTTAPVISSVAMQSITVTSATVNWTTNEASDTQLEYGSSTAYGVLTPLATGKVTAHSVLLSGLTSGTTYHVRVRSRDAAGNLATSPDRTFTTLQVPGGTDTTVPTISAISVQSITTTSATITWTTNEASDGRIRYGLTANYSTVSNLMPNSVTAHSATLAGLAAGTTYHFRVESRDAAGNLAQSLDRTFTTASAPVPTGNLLVNNSFSQLMHGWSAYANAIVLNGIGTTGGYALQVGTAIGGAHQTVPAVPWATYTLSGYARVVSATGDVAWLVAEMTDSNGAITRECIPFMSTAYQSKSVTFTTPANLAMLRVWCWKNGSGTHAQFDQLSLVRIR